MPASELDRKSRTVGGVEVTVGIDVRALNRYPGRGLAVNLDLTDSVVVAGVHLARDYVRAHDALIAVNGLADHCAVMRRIRITGEKNREPVRTRCRAGRH